MLVQQGVKKIEFGLLGQEPTFDFLLGEVLVAG
jgi:hypothetical protein